MTSIRFHGGADLDALADRFREAPRRLVRDLESGLSAAARPAAQEVRREIRSVPMGQRRMWSAKSQRRVGRGLGRGSSPLRSPIAAAVDVDARVRGDAVSVSVLLREQQVPTRVRWFVPYVTGRKKRLRHPFMGRWRYAVQANQTDLDRWWPVLKRHTQRFAQARDEAVRRAERYIGGS